MESKQFLRRYQYKPTNLNFDDIIMPEKLKQELKGLCKIYKNIDEYEKGRNEKPKGTLLYGIKDSGKTLSAKAIASELDLVMYHITAENILNEERDATATITDVFLTVVANMNEEIDKRVEEQKEKLRAGLENKVSEEENESSEEENAIEENIENMISSELITIEKPKCIIYVDQINKIVNNQRKLSESEAMKII